MTVDNDADNVVFAEVTAADLREMSYQLAECSRTVIGMMPSEMAGLADYIAELTCKIAQMAHFYPDDFKLAGPDVKAKCGLAGEAVADYLRKSGAQIDATVH